MLTFLLISVKSYLYCRHHQEILIKAWGEWGGRTTGASGPQEEEEMTKWTLSRRAGPSKVAAHRD